MRHQTPIVASLPSFAMQLNRDAATSHQPDAALLDLVDPVLDTRIILIGSGTLELMCALIRRGCPHAAALQLTDRPQAGSADVALVPDAGSPECVATAVALARRALAPLGSLVLRFAEGSPDALARHARRTLQLHGFSAIHARSLGGHRLLTAELPLHGRLACA